MDNIDELEALATTIYHVSSVLFSKLFSLDILQYIQLKRKYIPLPQTPPPPKPYKHHYTH